MKLYLYRMSAIYEYLSTVDDFRMAGKCRHKLSGILYIGLLTCLSNGEDCEDTVLFARTRKDFLLERITLENGIPSHDTFNRVFSTLSPDVLPQCLDKLRKRYDRFVVGEANLPGRQKAERL
jgi:hypothetical protein